VFLTDKNISLAVAAMILLDSARVEEGGVHAAGQYQFSVNYEVEYTCLYKTEQCLTFHPIGMRIQSGCPIRTLVLFHFFACTSRRILAGI
jgi:hypothetical protein